MTETTLLRPVLSFGVAGSSEPDAGRLLEAADRSLIAAKHRLYGRGHE